MKIFSILVMIATASVSGADFFDDFEDDYIGDWVERCNPADWYAQDGMAHCESWSGPSPNALIAPGSIFTEDCTIRASGSAVHVIGLVARLDESDTGVMGYVSPDHNVARIRLVSNGNLGEILASIDADFPSDVQYNLTLVCQGEDLQFLIEAPVLDMEWQLSATDPDPGTGQFGLLTGDEPHACWEWFQASQNLESETGIWACDVDDDSQGGSAGDGDMAFEAGETIEFGLAVWNGEQDELENAFAVLQSLSPEIDVPVATAEFGTILPGSFTWSGSDYVIAADPGAAEGVTYPMVLSLFADGGYFSQHSFDLPLGEGYCSDFETGGEGWTWSPVEAGWNDQWHVTGQRNHTPGGSASFKCGDEGGGDYADHLYSGLGSPCFNAALGSTLSFWMWIDAQSVRSAAEALDGGRLQIGQFGRWQDLVPPGGYPYDIVSGTTGPFEPGTGVYSGTEGWQLVTIALPDSLCGPRQLRWVFGSDDEGNREGWYIDDVLVVADQVSTEGADLPSLPFGISVFPNPCGVLANLRLTGDPMGIAVIEVYDLSGRMVWSHTGQLDADGTLELGWDLTSCSGERLPAGIYSALVLAGDRSVKSRLVITGTQ
ncbi:MAG: hypothetical protein AVO35_11610 [Candidatus Aegiribacteria sp. MLS_C]|nr:MAG: hypothetical protein AVO35_11610 [Candidatus Aegiribacteria sp. MLS_C]